MSLRPDLIVVGGGIAGSAAALRAAQYRLRTCWIRGDEGTRRRSRGQWVVNVDNMIGVHPGIVTKKILKLLSAPEHAAARALVEGAHLHIGTRDIIDNVVERIAAEHSDVVTSVEARATTARREGALFAVEAGGETFTAPSLVLATGVMDRQPLIKKARGGEVRDQPDWIYPFANRESVLYCIRCEGHLTAESCTAVIGSSEAAAWISIMLHERYASSCAILTNGEPPTWSEETGRLLERYRLPVHQARIVDLAGKRGALHELALEDGTVVPVQFAMVALGLQRVYNELAHQLGAALDDPSAPLDQRHVLIDERGETNVPGLFAVGDVSRHAERSVMKQIYTSQEYAVRALDVIDARVRRARRSEGA